ncbi:MAG: DUF393 domain-containing protein [Deltaproteobacteria bacterium]|nr:DUF393 domain-containing protein [Deltaproteobacteria bacterium]
MVIEHLTVLYDAECGFCCRCRAWLEQQPSLVELELVSREAPGVAARFPGLAPGDDELVVVDNAGGVYRGPDAFIVCLWALVAYRPWAMRLASPGLRPLARLAFEMVSSQRHRLAEWLSLRSDADLARALQLQMGLGAPRCARPA